MQSRERINDTPEQGSSRQATQHRNMPPRQHRPIQRRASPGHSVATVLMGEAPSPPLSAPSGGGSPLPEGVRTKMEGALGMDFSSVQVHEGGKAPSIGALAYTQGAHIHFAPGQYRPYSQRGQEIVGHELTHVVQQAEGRVRATRQMMGLGLNDDPALEREADVIGGKAARREAAARSASMPIDSHASGPRVAVRAAAQEFQPDRGVETVMQRMDGEEGASLGKKVRLGVAKLKPKTNEKF